MHDRPFLGEASSTIASIIGQFLGVVLLLTAFGGLFVLVVALLG